MKEMETVRMTLACKAHSHDVHLTRAGAADGCVAAARYENFHFFAHGLLQHSHVSNTQCVNET